MSAELVDPFTTPEHQPPLTADEWTAVRDELWNNHWDDRALWPDCLTEAVKTLGEIGLQGEPGARRTATQCLRRLAYRAKTGVPFGEPQEPAWSLDTSTRASLIRTEDRPEQDLWPDSEPFIRRVETVVDDL